MAWQTPKTNWTASDPIGTADLNRIEGNEAQLRTDLDTHMAATTGVHGATSAATAHRLVIRDAFGRAKFAAPFAPDDAARKQEVDVVQTNLTNHIADYVRQPGFGVTSGSGNAYTVTLSPAPSAYVDGMGVVIRANRDNTGPSTLNVNGLGARSIKRANGLDIAPGMIKNGGIYTLRYSAASGNFILQGEGSDVLFLYYFGIEHVPWVTGYTSGNPTYTKESDHLKIVIDANEDGTWVTDLPVNTAGYSKLLIYAGDFPVPAIGQRYAVLSTNKNGDSVIFNFRQQFSDFVNIFDISALSPGNYYFRVHRDLNSTPSQPFDFRIYLVALLS